MAREARTYWGWLRLDSFREQVSVGYSYVVGVIRWVARKRRVHPVKKFPRDLFFFLCYFWRPFSREE